DQCGPCKRLSGLIKDQELDKDGLISELDVTSEPGRSIAGSCGIRSLPTVAIVNTKENKIINDDDKIVGYQPESFPQKFKSLKE
ncbi:hypothetical protein, partial [Xylella fastidiosa]|uniref:hypothetical protein n=1 Tax=Xylella fastidiosa TaxID=2371 RepID=UPI000B08036C